MKSLQVLFCAMSLLLLAGCPGDDAALLFENAHYEESVMNWAHAKEIYQDIVTRYPSSKEAALARIRLEDLKNQE